MNNRKRATRYFLLGYLIATAGGFALYYSGFETGMGVFTITVMPAVFLVLAYKYFRKNLREASPFFDHDLLWLAVYWLALSLFSDALVYVFLASWTRGASPNWAFFRDQSPWIWFNYVTLVLTVLVAKWFYYKKRQPPMNTDGSLSSPINTDFR